MNKPIAWEIKCGACKFRIQGKVCSYCGHTDQKDKDLKGYVYYNFSCELGETLTPSKTGK